MKFYCLPQTIHFRIRNAIVIICALFVFLFSFSAAQDESSKNLEIQIRELCEKAYGFSTSNVDSGLLLAKEAFSLAQQSGGRKYEILPRYRIGQLYRIKGEFKNAGKYLHEAFDLSKTFSDSSLMLGILNDLSRFYIESSADYSLQLQVTALDVAQKTNDSANIGGIYNNIGNIYLQQKKYAAALDHFFISKSIWEKINPANRGGIFSDIGNVYYRTARYDSALFYYYKSLAANNAINDRFGMGYSLNNIGLVHLKQKQFQKSLAAIMQSMAYRTEVGSYEGKTNSLFNLSLVYEEMGDLTKALDFALQHYSLAQERDSKLILMRAHERLQRIYAKQNDFKNAYFHQNKMLEYSDSINTLEKERQYAQLEVLYHVDRKEIENSYLKERQEKQTVMLRQQRNLTIILGVFFAFALIAILFLYVSNKEKLRANKQLQEQKAIIEIQKSEVESLNAVKDKLFSVLSHDLIIPISSMQQMLQSLKEKIPIELGMREQILRTLTSADHIILLLENMLHWSKNQWREFKVHPAAFTVHELVHNESLLFQMQIMLKRIHLENIIPQTIKAFADVTMIGIVIRNLISNAVKFTPDGGYITVSAQSSEKAIEITISDTGPGIPAQTLKNLFKLSSTNAANSSESRGVGLGLILCKEFVEKNGGAVSVTTSEEKGTTFSFTIPAA